MCLVVHGRDLEAPSQRLHLGRSSHRRAGSYGKASLHLFNTEARKTSGKIRNSESRMAGPTLGLRFFTSLEAYVFCSSRDFTSCGKIIRIQSVSLIGLSSVNFAEKAGNTKAGFLQYRVGPSNHPN